MHRLLEAIDRDNLVAIRKLLESKEINLNQEVVIGEEYELDEPDEVPLLLYIIQNGASLEATELLLEYGVDITELNSDGIGALDIAIKCRRMDIVKLCESHGVSLIESRRKSGITPLILAASFNDINMVDFLISKGADIKSRDNYGMSAYDYAKRMGQTKMMKFIEDAQAK